MTDTNIVIDLINNVALPLNDLGRFHAIGYHARS